MTNESRELLSVGLNVSVGSVEPHWCDESFLAEIGEDWWVSVGSVEPHLCDEDHE